MAATARISGPFCFSEWEFSLRALRRWSCAMSRIDERRPAFERRVTGVSPQGSDRAAWHARRAVAVPVHGSSSSTFLSALPFAFCGLDGPGGRPCRRCGRRRIAAHRGRVTAARSGAPERGARPVQSLCRGPVGLPPQRAGLSALCPGPGGAAAAQPGPFPASHLRYTGLGMGQLGTAAGACRAVPAGSLGVLQAGGHAGRSAWLARK